MASEITEHDQNASPNVHDDGNGALGMENRGVKRARAAADDDDDDDDKPGRERRKIEIKFIQDKSRRHITFSKRKAGIMKKVRFSPVNFSCARLPTCPPARLPACPPASEGARQRGRTRARIFCSARPSPARLLACLPAASTAQKPFANPFPPMLGLRIVGSHRHPSPAARRVRDRARLHLHHTQAATTRHQARGQEPHPGTLHTPRPFAPRCAASHC